MGKIEMAAIFFYKKFRREATFLNIIEKFFGIYIEQILSLIHQRIFLPNQLINT